MRTISQIIDFIKVHSKVKSDSGVAKLLGMEAPALFNHKKRGTIPYKKITTYCENEGVTLAEVLNVETPNNPDEGERMFLKQLVVAQAEIIALQKENKFLRDELLKKPIPSLKNKSAS